MNNQISLCMIVKNEENNIIRCLNSIKDMVDEIIVVDTGSSDKTVAIAESYGAKVYHFQWTNSFSEARNESLKYATKDWILIMDADDEFCSEDKEKFKELINNSLDEKLLYFFETLNYCGSVADSNNISVNLNPRLYKNNYGYNYAGDVHNQLVNYKNNIKDVTLPIRIYHYGYLEGNIKSKDKRKRNISLLEEQLKKNPSNKYTCFNLGNEYFALGDMVKALEYYYKSFEDFNSNAGYGFILLIRIVMANYSIGKYDTAIEFADTGLKYYPIFTDLYFFKAIVYKTMNRPTLAIKALEKCIEIGEPPSELKFLYGTGSFKALYELGNIYMELKDYETAYKYFVDTIRAKSSFVVPVYHIAHILKERKTPIDEFRKVIERFFNDYPKAYPIIADIFYTEGYYKITLEYIAKAEEGLITSESMNILKAKALIRTGAFEQCIEMNCFTEESSFYLYFFMYKVLSLLLTNENNQVLAIINKFNNNPLSDYNKKILQIYTQFIKLFLKEPIEVLSDNENEKEYTAIILEICEILLINKKFDEFEAALNLLNLISDKSVLLQLGKLYYKYGFIDMAKKEIIRSIKEFELYDNAALDILR